MILRLNNVQPSNFERLKAFVDSPKNQVPVRIPRQPADRGEEERAQKGELWYEKPIRVVKILNHELDPKSTRGTLIVQVILKDFVIDWVFVPNKGWYRVILPMPRALLDTVLDCLKVMPVEAEEFPGVAIIQEQVVSAHLFQRFSRVADDFSADDQPVQIGPN